MRKNSVHPRRGLFITVEGPEGAGKSSQLRLLAEYLESRGRSCLCTREPGGTPLAETIRAVVKNHRGAEAMSPETELLLMEAARIQHVRGVIAPALTAGIDVLCDRFTDSTTAYQGGGRGIPFSEIRKLNTFAQAGCAPDLTLLLDLDPEIGFRRASGREETRGQYDRFEAEKLEFHRRVRAAFLAIARAEPKRIRIVDASGSVNQVQSEIRKIVDPFIG